MATCIIKTEETESDTRLCDACKRDNETISAVNWCKDCKDALCDPCSTVHRRIRSTAKHKTVLLRDTTEDDMAAMSLDINTTCPLHLDQPLIMYCKFHNEICCVVCTCNLHNTCKTIVPIEELAEGCIDRKVLDNWSKEFLGVQHIVQKAVEESELVLVSLDSDKETVSSDVESLVVQVQEKLHHLHSMFNNNLQEKHNALKDAQQQTLAALLEFRETIGKYASITQSLCHVSPKDALVKAYRMQKKTTDKYTTMTGLLENNPVVELKLFRDSAIKTLLNDITKIAETEEENQPMTSLTEIKPINTIIKHLYVGLGLGSPAQTLVDNLMVSEVRLVESRTWDEMGVNSCPWFTDGAYLNEDTLLFSDFRNRRLIFLSSELKMKKDLAVDGNPSCIALNEDKNEFCVVCSTVKILRFSYPGLQMINTIEGFGAVMGLAVTNDKLITGHGDHVAIRDRQGIEQQIIQTPRNISFTYSNHIVFSETLEQFCHCDLDTVIRRNMKCDEMWRYSSKMLEVVRGICCDPLGNVYVVGLVSQNVHQISADGSKQRIVVDKMTKITKPYTIVFHPTKNVFIVTSLAEEVALEVYEFVA